MQTPTHLPYLWDIFIYSKNCQISVFKREILQRIGETGPKLDSPGICIIPLYVIGL